MQYYLIISLILAVLAMPATAQELDQHRWKQRLILIQTPNEQDPNYRAQINALQHSVEGLAERKLMIYQYANGKYQQGLTLVPNAWSAIETNFDGFDVNTDVFELVLIGLDGNVKLRRNRFVTTNELFSLIDSMPMRMREIRQNRQ